MSAHLTTIIHQTSFMHVTAKYEGMRIG